MGDAGVPVTPAASWSVRRVGVLRGSCLPAPPEGLCGPSLPPSALHPVPSPCPARTPVLLGDQVSPPIRPGGNGNAGRSVGEGHAPEAGVHGGGACTGGGATRDGVGSAEDSREARLSGGVSPMHPPRMRESPVPLGGPKSRVSRPERVRPRTGPPPSRASPGGARPTGHRRAVRLPGWTLPKQGPQVTGARAAPCPDRHPHPALNSLQPEMAGHRPGSPPCPPPRLGDPALQAPLHGPPFPRPDAAEGSVTLHLGVRRRGGGQTGPQGRR